MLVSTLAHAEKVFAHAHSNWDWFVIDTETVSKHAKSSEKWSKKDTLVWRRMRIFLFSICCRGESYSFVCDLFDPKFPSFWDYAQFLHPIFSDKKLIKVNHNVNYDESVFRVYDLRQTPIWDTMIGGWMANPNIDRYAFKTLKARAPLYGRHLDATKTVAFSNLEEVSHYAEGDALATDELYQMQRFGEVKRPPLLWHIDAKNRRVCTKNEFPTSELNLRVPGEDLGIHERRLLRYMEFPYLMSTIDAQDRGMPFALKACQKMRHQIKQDLQRKQSLALSLLPQDFRSINLGSNGDVAKALVALKVPVGAKTAKGALSVSTPNLIPLQGAHPFVKALLEYRATQKIFGTYVGEDGWEQYVHEDGRIHPSISTVGSVTGRNTCSNPNLMQIPSAKDQYGLKKLFVAPKGQLLICLDYSQLEIRMMCVFCKDPAMTEIMRDPHGDIHTNTAKEFNVPRSPVAKFINFNLQYGGGGWMMSQILTVAGVPTTQEEGEKYRQMYDNTYPGVHLFRQKMYDFHRCEGYFPYIHGMRRVVPDLNSKNARMVHGAENQLVNNIIQGSGQVLVKQSVLRADYMQPNWDAKYLKVLSAKSGNSRHKAIIAEYAKQVEIYRKLFEAAHCRFLMQVHDELLFCVDAEAAVEAGNALADLMTWIPWFVPVTPFHIPLKVDGGIGKSWKEAKGDSAIAKIEFFGKRYD